MCVVWKRLFSCGRTDNEVLYVSGIQWFKCLSYGGLNETLNLRCGVQKRILGTLKNLAPNQSIFKETLKMYLLSY